MELKFLKGEKMKKVFDFLLSKQFIAYLSIVFIFFLSANNILADDAAFDQSRFFLTKILDVIKAGLYMTGGGIGLFGSFQLIMAYLQSNPTEYANAVKKIVAGGMLIALGFIASSFVNIEVDTTGKVNEKTVMKKQIKLIYVHNNYHNKI